MQLYYTNVDLYINNLEGIVIFLVYLNSVGFIEIKFLNKYLKEFDKNRAFNIRLTLNFDSQFNTFCTFSFSLSPTLFFLGEREKKRNGNNYVLNKVVKCKSFVELSYEYFT